IEQHPVYGRDLLEEIEYLQPAIDILYHHHEKWDGSGYPKGLEKDQIPLKARIFAVIDVYDALTSERPYRDAWPSEKAKQYILDQAGEHFDPMVVDQFLEIVD
ncbi:MAG: HD domain-containing protein, partial [Anaerolineales bacterium]|nr:HD domain-containing protein [Anaerolineales bacterium]